MSKIEVDTIAPQSGTTVTLGESGDTVNIPSGVTITNNGTQTGFGRTGTVDWDTTAKTTSCTAVSGNGYFVNTTSGAITVTLPAGKFILNALPVVFAKKPSPDTAVKVAVFGVVFQSTVPVLPKPD